MGHKRARDDRDGHSQHLSSKIPKTHHNHNGHQPRPPHTSNTAVSNNQPPRTATTHTDPLAALNAKHPDTAFPYPSIPPYNPDVLLPLRTTLPPLPPLLPGPLSTSPFTHASVLDAKYGSSTHLTYERLEFLGDAYLETIATRLIFSRFPTLPTGRQAQLRERLVRNSTLAGFARAYGFGERILWSGAAGGGEKGWGEKVEADVFEAYVAAVILSWPEDGFRRVEEWLTGLWTGVLLEEAPEVVQNRKDELQRLVGGKEVKVEYLEEGTVEGGREKGLQKYGIGVFVTGWGYEKVRLGGGVGVGRKEAGMKAVLDAFERSAGIIEEMAEKKRKFTEARKAATAGALEEVRPNKEASNGHAASD